MKYLNVITIGLIGVLASVNIYQRQSFLSYQQVINNKDALISNGYDEMIIHYLKEVKETNNEIIKNQGRTEGILSVIQNYKPEENQYTAIWHNGYYSGLEQKEYQNSIEPISKIAKDKK